MTRILVLSDTHLSSRAIAPPFGEGIYPGGTELLERLAEVLESADLILHAGDHDSYAFYQALSEKGRLIAIHGNSDDSELKTALPEKRIIACEGLRIGLIHGWGADEGMARRIYDFWSVDPPNVIVFGHTHQAYHRNFDGVLMFNPGSPARPRGHGATCGWLEIHGNQCVPSVISLP
jgi:putative phosphoesterase